MDAEMATSPTNLSKKLRWLCDQHGINQVQLAEMIDVGQGTVSQYLDKAMPGPAKLLRIAREFGVPMTWLADETKGVEHFNSAVAESLDYLSPEAIIDYVTSLYADECNRVEKNLNSAALIPFEQLATEIQSLDDAGELPIDADEFPAHIGAAFRALLAIHYLPMHTLDHFRALDKQVERAGRLHENLRSTLDRIAGTSAARAAFREYSRRVVSMERDDALAETDDALKAAKSAFPSVSEEPTAVDKLHAKIEEGTGVDPDLARGAGFRVNRARKSKPQ